MDKNEAASRLNGSEYGKEGSRELFQEMRASRLVAVFGYSDDLTELRGAVDDETSADVMLFDHGGMLVNKCDCDDCPYWADRKASAGGRIKPLWDEPLDSVHWSWRYDTAIPHATFDVMEDGEPYCLGIVFSLDELSA